jgi:argininosuccinate lyase
MSNEQNPNKMWSGRFREPLNRDFEQWQRSFPFDWRLLPQEVAASMAHAETIAAAGILTSEELTKTLEGLTRVAERPLNWSNRISATSGQVDYETSDQQVGAAIVASAPQAEDIHHYVELELTREIGNLALKLHTGRSRNEQIATDMRLFVRDSIDATLTGLDQWINALLLVADAHQQDVMPSYTHLQRAEPVLIAHWLLAYVSMIERDASRFADARARLNLCPLGSGAVAGATLSLDRTIASKALGFTAPTPNSMDATSDRDFMPPPLGFTSPALPKKSLYTPLQNLASSIFRKLSPQDHRRCRKRRILI